MLPAPLGHWPGLLLHPPPGLLMLLVGASPPGLTWEVLVPCHQAVGMLRIPAAGREEGGEESLSFQISSARMKRH